MKRILFSCVFICYTIFAQEIGARYLIITHDNYYNSLKPLAEWKTQKGYRAKIVRLSEIGGDSVQIRNYIVNAYNTWQIKPAYCLLVGNKYQIPFPYMGQAGGYVFYSDNYYTNVTGDFRNDIIPGRFWVYDSNQVKSIVAKVLGYEKQPYLADPVWFKKGTTIVNVDDYPPYSDSVYWADAHFAHGLMNNAGYMQIDSLSDSFGDSSIDVIKAINDGRSYILYRGVGFIAWDFPFWDIDTADMHNGFKLPVVISATCATVEDIGYQWLNAGSLQEPKGIVGFFGTTTAIMSGAELRSALAKGTLQAIFCDSFVTLGRAAEAGRLYYYNLFGNTQEYHSWTCLGDPEMCLWTTTPRQIAATYADAWVGDTFAVRITYNAQPVESALVCVKAKYDTTKYFSKRTDENGWVKFIGRLTFPDSALLTITGRNIYPHIDTIIGGYIGGPFIKYSSYLILDTIGGNGNFQPNNGEAIELAVWIENIGDSTAQSVYGILQKAEPDIYYQISDTIKFFGDIHSGDSAFTSEDGFNISIHPDCPDSHIVKLKLTMEDNQSHSWISYFDFLVYSPRPYIVYRSCSINDSINGNGDGKINPGENIELPVWIQNIGDSMAENVIGTLRKQIPDSFFILEDTIKFFGLILPQESVSTGSDGFNIKVDTFCPDQHLLQLQFRITDSLDSTWVYNFALTNHAPNLTFYNYYFNDSLKYIDRGDTAPLIVLIKNNGSTSTHNVTSHLISPDTFITVLSDSSFYGTVYPDSIMGNYLSPFIIYAHPQTPPGYLTTIKLAFDGTYYHDTIDFQIYIGQRDYLVWDPDPNHTSGFILHQKLISLHYIGDYRQNFPREYLNIYRTFFATFGMNPDKFTLNANSPIVSEILDYLYDGGKMYLEGGDVWYYDPQNGGFNFCPLFCITPVANNIGIFSGISGNEGTFTQQMSFNYTGEASSIDRINPAGIGIAIFKNRYNNNYCGVAANNQTVGVSFEFGGLVDSVVPSTKQTLIDSIMHYFGINPSGGIGEENECQVKIKSRLLECYPNPFLEKINIRYAIP
ncbi:MAG: C25 family cysteine peptidase, partial [bacterium]